MTTKMHTFENALVWAWPKASLNWFNIMLIQEEEAFSDLTLIQPALGRRFLLSYSIQA